MGDLGWWEHGFCLRKRREDVFTTHSLNLYTSRNFKARNPGKWMMRSATSTSKQRDVLIGTGSHDSASYSHLYPLIRPPRLLLLCFVRARGVTSILSLLHHQLISPLLSSNQFTLLPSQYTTINQDHQHYPVCKKHSHAVEFCPAVLLALNMVSALVRTPMIGLI